MAPVTSFPGPSVARSVAHEHSGLHGRMEVLPADRRASPRGQASRGSSSVTEDRQPAPFPWVWVCLWPCAPTPHGFPLMLSPWSKEGQQGLRPRLPPSPGPAPRERRPDIRPTARADPAVVPAGGWPGGRRRPCLFSGSWWRSLSRPATCPSSVVPHSRLEGLVPKGGPLPPRTRDPLLESPVGSGRRSLLPPSRRGRRGAAVLAGVASEGRSGGGSDTEQVHGAQGGQDRGQTPVTRSNSECLFPHALPRNNFRLPEELQNSRGEACTLTSFRSRRHTQPNDSRWFPSGTTRGLSPDVSGLSAVPLCPDRTSHRLPHLCSMTAPCPSPVSLGLGPFEQPRSVIL